MAQTNTVDKELEQARDDYFDALGSIAARVREQLVVPFCDKHSLRFVSGNGTWAFFTTDERSHRFRYHGLMSPHPNRDGVLVSDDGLRSEVRGAKRVLDQLELSVGNVELGTLVDDYCPRDSEEK